MATKGERAYELREDTGKPWEVVAAEVGCASVDAAIAGAKKYALRKGLKWPVHTVRHAARDQVQLNRALRRAAKDEEVYLAVAGGAPIMSIKGYTPYLVYKALERHCLRTGAPPLPRNPERAYRMRAEQQLRWEVIARDLGYGRDNAAIEAARLFALANDLPWPVKITSTPMRPGWTPERYVGKRYYEAVVAGASWEEVAAAHKRDRYYVKGRAALYARAFGKPWPLKAPKSPPPPPPKRKRLLSPDEVALLGKVPDADLAVTWGVSKAWVMNERRSRRIYLPRGRKVVGV